MVLRSGHGSALSQLMDHHQPSPLTDIVGYASRFSTLISPARNPSRMHDLRSLDSEDELLRDD